MQCIKANLAAAYFDNALTAWLVYRRLLHDKTDTNATPSQSTTYSLNPYKNFMLNNVSFCVLPVARPVRSQLPLIIATVFIKF